MCFSIHFILSDNYCEVSSTDHITLIPIVSSVSEVLTSFIQIALQISIVVYYCSFMGRTFRTTNRLYTYQIDEFLQPIHTVHR